MRFLFGFLATLILITYPTTAHAHSKWKLRFHSGLPEPHVLEMIERCNPEVNTLDMNRVGVYNLECKNGKNLEITVESRCPAGWVFVGVSVVRAGGHPNGGILYSPFCSP